MFQSPFFAADYFRAALARIDQGLTANAAGGGRVAAYERQIEAERRRLADDEEVLLLMGLA